MATRMAQLCQKCWHPSHYQPATTFIRYKVPSSHFLWSSCTNEWETQMLAKPSMNLLQRTGGNHRGSRAQLGWRTFMITCLCWILGYMRLEIWCKIGLSADWCLCAVLCTRSGACYCWIGTACTLDCTCFCAVDDISVSLAVSICSALSTHACWCPRFTNAVHCW